MHWKIWTVTSVVSWQLNKLFMIIGIEAAHAVKPFPTGVEVACREIITHLSKQISDQHQVKLYSHIPVGRTFGDLPVNWQERILSWPLHKLWSQLRLSIELIINPPRVFFSPGQLIPIFSPRHTVVYLHDSAFLFVPEAYSFWGGLYLRWMNWLIVRKAETIITSTEFNKAELVKYYGDKITSKITVIPLAYDNKMYHSAVVPFSGAELKQKFGISKPYILYVGRLETKKNTATLIRAFDKLRRTIDCQLVLAGRPGRGYELVQVELQKAKYQSDIIRPGWVEQFDLPRLVKSARVVVVPSIYEGFGLPVLDAMAVGTPVVVSDIPALKEVGGDAVLVADTLNPDSWANNLKQVFLDEDLFQKMTNNGFGVVKLYSWDKTAEKIAKILTI